ncbi:MAG: ABC transporter substrate-binding protein [Candidatus Binatia bacterium]
MNKKLFWLFACLLLAGTTLAQAQQPTKLPRIGLLRSGSVASVASHNESFVQALQDLGYVNGSNITIDFRYADGKPERWPVLAAELVRSKVDIIVTAGIGPARAAKQETATIPIIVATAGDLVRTGLVASLARPGGNITGSTEISPDLAGKRVELLKEILPRASKVAVIWHMQPGASDDDEELKAIESAARDFNVNVVPVGVGKVVDGAYTTMSKNKPDAVIILRSSVTLFNRKQLAEFSIKNYLPSLCEGNEFTGDGCLMSYGPDVLYNFRRAAVFVDKILKGTKPGDIPVEQPTKFELVINLKAAKQIGLTIPPNVLARADKVIR